MRMLIAAVAAVVLGGAGAAVAEGNFASKPTRLPTLVLKKDLTMSEKEFRLSTGKYYRWSIESEGGEEFLVQAPDLIRNSWIDQIVISDIEVMPLGGIHGVEFDDAGTADIWFVPLRPGDYEFYVAGHRERGMRGKFIVR
jgi:uncharacterized cupredoxin-like copper-binding protein